MDIGANYLLGGSGFDVTYSDKRFYTRPHQWDDVDRGELPKRFYTIINQDLILGKPYHNLGDSLYGQFSFDIIEKYYGKTIKHNSHGIFRARVTVPEYTRVAGKKAVLVSHYPNNRAISIS